MALRSLSARRQAFAPDQVRVITLNDDEALINYAKPIGAELRANTFRVDADYRATPFKAKIANAELW